ncbi:MAG: diacylglycerol kinase family lipid kinase [Clostridiales bacterium]|nr:diacylglycerol kinase family lipid kinase [Clostridiales bacterium]
MKHIFIVNPNSGKGKNKALEYIEPKIHEVCKKYNLDYKILVTGKKNDGIDFVRQNAAGDEPVRFYACGGDGTLYEVVNGAFGLPNVEVAVVPLGSGNDFVRLFGDKEIFLDLENVVNGVAKKLDVIKCGDEIAINQCSMGMDAEVCAMQGRIKKLPLVTGEGAYYIGCLYAILRKFKNRFTVTYDDKETAEYNCLFCFIGNSRYYGGGFKAAPLAEPDDGLLDFVVVESIFSRLKLTSLLNSYKRGEHLDWEATHFTRGKKLKIHSQKPAAINVDGECRYVTDAEFEIIENGITFVIPKTSEFLKNRS